MATFTVRIIFEAAHRAGTKCKAADAFSTMSTKMADTAPVEDGFMNLAIETQSSTDTAINFADKTSSVHNSLGAVQSPLIHQSVRWIPRLC